MRKIVASLGTLLAFSLGSAPVWASGTTIAAEPLSGRKLRIDGVPKEWPGRATSLSVTLQGGGSGRASGQIGYDAKYVYVTLNVVDGEIVRTRAAGAGEDHASLVLAFPNTRGHYKSYKVDLYPGDPGKLPGAVKLGGRSVRGAKVVEAPTAKGFTLEAQIPWSVFPEAQRVRSGLRGALRYHDAKAKGRAESVRATGQGKGGSLPAVQMENEQALDAALLRPKNLPDRPARLLLGNLTGDKMLEQVAVYGTYLTIVGPSYRAGKEFYFGDLGIKSSEALVDLQLRDLSGDGYQEIVLRKRIGDRAEYREVLQVMKIGSNDAPFLAFSHEVAIKAGDVSIVNDVKLVGQGKKAQIIIAQGRADGVDPNAYSEPKPGNMASALLPWESVKSRTFAWQGNSIEAVDEKSWKPKLTRGGRALPVGQAARGPTAPPPPRPPSPEEMLERVYALYRKDRGVGAKKPRFDFVTDVVADRQPERVLVHGKDIVVFGKGFKGGTSYTFITIGVAEPGDVLHATAHDLTGDGKAEIIVRGVLHAKASKELGGDVVDRHALFVYQVAGEQLKRVFAAETGRALGEKRILGTVAFQPSEKGLRIELRPGRAIGWTEKSYPFPADQTAAGGLEPLLLPWGDGGARRYRFSGQGYVAE